MLRTTTAAVALMAALATPGAMAEDKFSCGVLPTADGEPCDDLTAANLPAFDFDVLKNNEITSNELAFDGTPGDTADLTFSFLFDSGGFNFCFGMCLESDIDPALLAAAKADVLTDAQRKAFALGCLMGSSYSPIFDDIASNPDKDDPPTKTVTGVSVPSSVIFFLLPNDKAATFKADPNKFFPTSPGAVTEKVGPLFSLSNANPGGKDQLVIYADNERSVFTWEDKQRVPGSPEGASDEDFSDLVFSVDSVLIPNIPDVCPTVRPNYDVDSDNSATSSSLAGGKCACIEFD